MALVLTGHRLLSETSPTKGVKPVVGCAPQPLAGELSLLAEVLRHAQHGAQQHHQHHEYLHQTEHHSSNSVGPSGHSLNVALV